MNNFCTKPEVIEQPEIKRFPGEDYSHLHRGDTIWMQDGRQMVIIRRMDQDGWRYLVQEMLPEDFDIVEYLNS